MDYIVIAAGVSPSNSECVFRLHVHSVVVGTATTNCDVKKILMPSRELQTLPATAGHWLMTSPGNGTAEDIGESCRFLFTAVRETHWLCPPETLWQQRWHDHDHLEYAAIMQYKACKPLLGIGKELRLMLCLCGAKCSREKFRQTGAIGKLELYGVHGIVILHNEETVRPTSHLRDSGALRDGNPSRGVEKALKDDGVDHWPYHAGGSVMLVLGKQQAPTLPQVQAKQWRGVTTFWVGKARGGRSDAARAARNEKSQTRWHSWDPPRPPQQLLRREYLRSPSP